MDNLPPVLLDEVFLRAGFADTSRACKVSRAWRARAEGDALWRCFILKRWPTLGKVVEVLDQREEPGAMRAFFRNRLMPEWERMPDGKNVRDTNQDSFKAYFQPLYLQAEVWLEGGDKARRSLGGFTVPLTEQPTVATLFCVRGIAVSGLPKGLTTADLEACKVQLTVLDTSRGVSMLLVQGTGYTRGCGCGNLWKCGSLAGHHYEASVPWTGVRLELRPNLMVHTTANGREVSSLYVRLEVDRAEHRQDLDEMDEDGEYHVQVFHSTVHPCYYTLLNMLDEMMGITFRIR